MATEAYKDHRAGSAKGKCHKVYDETKGDISEKRAATIKKAVALGKTAGSGSSWATEFGGKTAKKVVKKAKKTVKRERPAKSAKPKKSAKKAAKKPAVKREKLEAGASA